MFEDDAIGLFLLLLLSLTQQQRSDGSTGIKGCAGRGGDAASGGCQRAVCIGDNRGLVVVNNG